MTLLAVAYLLLAAQSNHVADHAPQPEGHSNAPAVQAGQAPAAKSERLICRRVGRAATGSTLGGDRRCLTAEQWQAVNQRR